MNSFSLDNIDHGILYALQRDARNTTTAEIADEVEVSASTVRNRIEKLEEVGIIEGYYPKINYELSNFPLHVLFVCNANPLEREQLAAAAIEVQGVIDVREMLTSTRNLYIEVVATDTRNLTTITNELAAMELEVLSSEIITSHRVRPWAEFEFQTPDFPSD
ncbi:Lrp/AsnC family transcriptional regulator [Haloferax sp. YSSS75]|uniref:Lrp/AsnC family transcriptional regulator n=1 Tax=Haloferax sp. YSSS75 TaxID=3388564 RepID=UPI00398D1B33